MIPDRQHINSLTGLRFFAALWVISLHYLSAPNSLPFLKNFIGLGARAVMLFFILSGFILTYTYAGRTIKIRNYFLARFRRIYPLYLVGIILGLPLIYVMADAFLIRRHLVAVLAAYVTGTQAWYPQDGYLLLNQPLWSISAEFFFYLLFPFIVGPVFAIAKNLWVTIVCCMLLIAAYLCLQEYSYPLTFKYFPALFKYGAPIWGWNPLVNLPLFVVGMFLGSLYLRIDPIKLRNKTGDIFLVVTILFLMFIKLPNQADIVITLLLFSIGILTLTQSNGPLSKLISSSPLQLLGNASYALYVLHSPLWHYYEFLYSTILRLDKSVTLFFNAGFMFIIIAAALLVHTAFEIPIRRMLNRGKIKAS